MSSEFSDKLRVAVVGAGVSGLSSAFQLLSSFKEEIQVTVLSKEHHEDTTSYVAAGSSIPLASFGLEAEHLVPKLRDWMIATNEYFEHLIATGESSERGVSTCFAVDFVTKEEPKGGVRDEYRSTLPFVKKLSVEELQKLYPHVDLSEIIYGNLTGTFCCRPAIYLRWLEREIQKLGGSFIYDKYVDNLVSLESQFDLVINTTGLGATQTAHDQNMVPIRGQIVYVDAPWVNTGLFFGHSTYIIPGGDGSVSLGGCWQEGDDDRSVRTDMKRGIFERCCKLIPSLKNARFIRDMAGLRPFRIGGPRVELEEVENSKLVIIHNYGHGSLGYGLHWGTSSEVLNLFTQWKSNKVSSKE